MDRRHCMGVVVSDLSPAEQDILQYLRTQVDRLQDERYWNDARPSIVTELQIAQRDLQNYTSDLRKKGYNI